jgi:hypothetical protein
MQPLNGNTLFMREISRLQSISKNRSLIPVEPGLGDTIAFGIMRRQYLTLIVFSCGRVYLRAPRRLID